MSAWRGWFKVSTAVLALTAAFRVAAADLSWLDDRAAVQNFVSGVVMEQIAQQQAVGVTVSIVRGGNIVMAQGYGIARPLPAQDLPAWVAHWQPDPRWADEDSPHIFAA